MPKVPMKMIPKKTIRAAVAKAGSLVALAAILGKNRRSIYVYLAKRKAPVSVIEQINAFLSR